MRHLLTAILVSIGVFASTLSANSKPFHHEFGELREYHQHWLAVCPDRFDKFSKEPYYRECWASTYTGVNGGFSGDFPGQRLSVARDRSTGELSITFVASLENFVDFNKNLEVTLSSGKKVSLTMGEQVKNNDNIVNEYVVSDKLESSKLISHMQKRTFLTLSLPLKDGTRQNLFFSLRGLNSALRFLEKYAQPSN